MELSVAALFKKLTISEMDVKQDLVFLTALEDKDKMTPMVNL